MEVETHEPMSKPLPFSFPLNAITHSLRPVSGEEALLVTSTTPECGDYSVSKLHPINNVKKDCCSPKMDCSGTGSSSAVTRIQKVYRSYSTRRRLADSCIVAEELWCQAMDYAKLNYSTISFFNFQKPESAISRWTRIIFNASKVGKGLSKDGNAQKLAFQHWIEAIDPRHRYGHCLHFYFEEWEKAYAGQPFFYWLDVGDGKDLDLKECSRSKLRQQCIKYLGPQERVHYEYVVIEGKIVHKQTGTLFDTSKGVKWIFVMSTYKKLYAGEKKKGQFHHSSFMAGGATLAAGSLVAENGVLKSITRDSGHYRPSDESLDLFLSILKEYGVDLDEVQVKRGNEDDKPTVTSKVSDEFKISEQEEQNTASEATETETETENSYKRQVSGSLKSQRAKVPKAKILERMHSKKATQSYQLWDQLSLKWTTGAGARIGCVADYPVQVQEQALEFVNLSPAASRSFKVSAHSGLPSPSVCVRMCTVPVVLGFGFLLMAYFGPFSVGEW